VDFDVFFSLWSCFDGVPGLYELAFNDNLFDKTGKLDKEGLIKFIPKNTCYLQKSRTGLVKCNTHF